MNAGKSRNLRWWQFSLRTLLLLPVLVSLFAFLGTRIHGNRQQRDAVHALWRMGVTTCNHENQPFTAPSSGIDWIWCNRENWIDDLIGTHEPIAACYDIRDSGNGDFSEGDCMEFAALAKRVPSIKNVVLIGMDDQSVKRIKELLPGVSLEMPPRQR